MQKSPIRILTNFRRLTPSLMPEIPLSFTYLPEITQWRDWVRALAACRKSDLIILNSWPSTLMALCVLKPFFPPRVKLVSVDLILRHPMTPKDRLKALVRRLLFLQVDHFLLYFKDLSGYSRFYGITPARSAYIPCKVNGWDQILKRPPDPGEGDHVLCAGRTMRDLGTFVEAMRRCGCPGLLVQQNPTLLAENGTDSWTGPLPENLTLLVDQGNAFETFVGYLARARVVVIPRFRHDISASGISTYLLAMLLRRPVVISEGPGVSDLLVDEAVIVPVEDPDALAQGISRLWSDPVLREDVVERGYRYAASLEGEERLYRNILQGALDALGACP